MGEVEWLGGGHGSRILAWLWPDFPLACPRAYLPQISDQNIIIPNNSLVEANQSGLIAEPLLDITPQLPIKPYTAYPLDPRCADEDAIVCHHGR